MKRSIKTRVTLFSLAIFVLGVWSLSMYVSRTLQTDMERVLGEQQLSTASIVAANINQELEERFGALDEVAKKITPAMLRSAQAMQVFMDDRAAIRSNFNAGAYITRLDGTAIASIPHAANRIGVNYMERDHVEAALQQGKATVSKPVIGKMLITPVVSLAMPLRDGQGKVMGALVGVIDLAKPNFFDKITQNHYGKTGGYVLIAPQHKLIVTATDKSRIMAPTAAPRASPETDRFLAGYEGTATYIGALGVEMLVSVKKVPVAGWILATNLPTTEAFAPIVQMQQRILLATILLTLLAGGVTWWMLRRELAPLASTALALSAMTRGNQPPQALRISHEDEIGTLVESFNHLLATLATRDVALTQSANKLRALFQFNTDALIVMDADRFIDANPAALMLFGCTTVEEFCHYNAVDLSPPQQQCGTDSNALAKQHLARVKAMGSHSFEWLHKRVDSGVVFYAQVQLSAMVLDEQVVTQATVRDITQQKQTERYEQFRSDTLKLLSTETPLPALLQAIVNGVEQLHPEMLCSILLLDSDGRHLGTCVAPSMPDFYNRAIIGVEIGAGVGSCGTAAFTGERIIVADISSHPYWESYKELAASAGLRACWSQPILGSAGQVLGTFAIYHRKINTPTPADIHLIEQSAKLSSIAIERKQAKAKLVLAASVFKHSHEGIFITDPRGIILDVNDAFTRITGFSHAEAVGQSPRIFKSGRQDETFYANMWRALAVDGAWTGEIWNRRKSGEVFAELQTISAVRDAQGATQQYVSLFSDISAIKAHQSTLEHLAHFDALTKLPNRLLLADRLQQAMNQAARRQQLVAVAYLDLDGFKGVNDRHGHDVGDQMLIAIASRMKNALRDGDTLARIGGDEFVAVLTDLTDAEACTPLVTRLLAAALQPMTVGDISMQVSASIGVTFYPQADGVEAEQLLRQADQAMYQAKVAGKNRFCVFDPVQDSSIRGHHESLEHIRRGLAQGQFVLYYQPKVNMRTGKVIGAEALIRWQHPEQGLLAPGAFLPVIEDHPLAIAVGEWVINTALSQIEQWDAQGLQIPVSVNIGARQLQQTDFVARLQALLGAHPTVSPTRLELEVLETSALSDMAQVSQVIEDCGKFGVQFALDDFGTGYSSLTYLKRLHVTLLKIDQSFVRDMLEDSDDLAILQGVIGLAAAFKREVIAEGVETVAHGTALLQLGCELAQGYGISRPMPAEKIPAWVASWQPAAEWSEPPTF